MTKLATAQMHRKQGQQFDLDELKETLCQTWCGAKDETYEIRFTAKKTALCTRFDSGRKSFTMWVDDDHKYLWWGTNCAYWCDLADLVADKTKVSWYSGTDWKKASKPRFVWWLANELEVESPKLSKEVVQQETQKDSAKHWKPYLQDSAKPWKPCLDRKAVTPQEAHVESTKPCKEAILQELPVGIAKRWKGAAPHVDSSKHVQKLALEPPEFPPGLEVPPQLQTETSKHSQQVTVFPAGLEAHVFLRVGSITPPPGLEAPAANTAPTSDSKSHEPEEGDTTASSECSDSDKEVSSRLGSADSSHSHTSDEESCYGPCESVQPVHLAAESQRPPELSDMPMTKLACMVQYQ